MTKNLVIVESPTKAKVIKQYLWRDYKVMSSNGHIRDLPAKKSELSAAQQKLPYASIWIDVDNWFEALYVCPPAKKKIINSLTEEMDKDTVIYLATDEDREWEAISWHLLEVLDKKRTHKNKRVVFHEITKDAIIEAFKNTRELNEDLVEAQQARRFLDRIVWYKLSPLLWNKVRFWLSAWRVQSVCVRLIVEREREIKAFKPEEYWSLTALLNKKEDKNNIFESKLVSKKWEKYIPVTWDECKWVLISVNKETFIVKDVEKKEVKRHPSPPFITSSLQQEASRKLGFSSKQTMMVAQKLYEWIEIKKWEMTGLITYMRTDSFNLSSKAVEDSREMLKKLYGKDYVLTSPRVFTKKAKWAQEAHEAIRPTEISRTPESLKGVLSTEQYKLYELIWKRTLATQAPSATIDAVKVVINAWDYGFQSNGQTIKFPGFLKVYVEGSDNPDEELKDKDTLLPDLKAWEVLDLNKLIPDQHFTKWPSRYTEASLIKKMEDEGIWRPSTYAPTIHTIQARGYVEKDGKALLPTDTAYVVTDLLVDHFNNIVDTGFTSKMEDELDKIAEGELKWKPWLKDFHDNLVKTVEEKTKELKKSDFTNLGETNELCEKCWKPMVLKLSKFWKFMSCSGYPECKNAKPIETDEEVKLRKELEAKYSGEKCPDCSGPMEIKTWKYGQFLACSKYPDCKWIKKIEIWTGVTCPMCNKWELVEKKTKTSKSFWSCNRYPDCDYATWSKPLRSWQWGFYTEKKWSEVFVEFDAEKYEKNKQKYKKKAKKA